MSEFVNWGFVKIPAGSSLDDAQLLVDTCLTDNGWQLTNQSVSEPNYSEFIPPDGEVIGDDILTQRVRLYYSLNGDNLDISIRGINFPVADFCSEMFVCNSFSGVSVASLAFGGETAPFGIIASLAGDVLDVTAADDTIMLGAPVYSSGPELPIDWGVMIVEQLTGTPGGIGTYRIGGAYETIASQAFETMAVTVVSGADTSMGSDAQNLAALYAAIKASTDPQVLAWNVQYIDPMQGGGTPHLLIERNYIYDLEGQYPGVVTRGWDSINDMAGVSCWQISWCGRENQPTNIAEISAAATDNQYKTLISGDILNGTFVYFSVFRRSFYLSLMSGFYSYGPGIAAYAENTCARAATPVKPSTLVFERAHISELFTGVEASTFAYAQVYELMPCNGWCTLGFLDGLWPDATIEDFGSYNPGAMAWAVGPTFYADMSPYSFGNMSTSYANALGALSVVPRDVVTDVLAMSYRGFSCDVPSEGGSTGSITFPPAFLADIFCEANTLNEQEYGAGGLPDTLANEMHLLTPMTDSDFPTALTLDKITPGMPLTGTIVIGGEAILYDGISGNNLLNVERDMTNTSMQAHYAGDIVMVAMWFMRLKNGMMPLGYIKPGDVPAPDGEPWPAWSEVTRVLTVQNGSRLRYPLGCADGPTPPGPTVVTNRPTVGTIWPRLDKFGSVTVVP